MGGSVSHLGTIYLSTSSLHDTSIVFTNLGKLTQMTKVGRRYQGRWRWRWVGEALRLGNWNQEGPKTTV